MDHVSDHVLTRMPAVAVDAAPRGGERGLKAINQVVSALKTCSCSSI